MPIDCGPEHGELARKFLKQLVERDQGILGRIPEMQVGGLTRRSLTALCTGEKTRTIAGMKSSGSQELSLTLRTYLIHFSNLGSKVSTERHHLERSSERASWDWADIVAAECWRRDGSLCLLETLAGISVTHISNVINCSMDM